MRQPSHHMRLYLGVLLWTLLWVSGPSSLLADDLVFVDVTAAAGLDYEHGLGDLPLDNASAFSGGVAAGDVDRDGYVDLFVVRGGLGPTQLWRNDGQGGFHEIGASLELDLDDPRLVAPLLADADGDGWLDLAVGGIQEAPLRLLRNGGGAFVDMGDDLGLFSTRNNLSSAMADYDRDGDLDWVVAHWSTDGGGGNHLWRNDGEVFSPVDWRVGIAPLYLDTDWTFTPIFSDLDGDGWPELLLASDFGTSRVFRNVPADDPADRLFVLDTRSDFTDENGMGAAVGDMDNDGDMDWFVSSIWDADGTPEGDWGITGNRLYQNRGDGSFDDISEAAGVRPGDWGWGSCFGDFNLDGWLDIFHTNGFQGSAASQFLEDPVRLFLNRGDGTFDEQAAIVGLDDTGLGRGVVCFDYDRDGDLDIFIANHSGPPKLYRNDLLSPGTQANRWLSVALQDDTSANVHGIGARITVTARNQSQVREIRCGSNYLSQDPSEAHFGLGDASEIERLHVLWPDGEEATYDDVAPNQHLVLRRGGPAAIDIPLLNGWGLLVWMSALAWAGWRRLRPIT